MTNERINILIASDINYAPYYGVLLTSLFTNNRSSSFEVHLITDNTWTKGETEKFEELCIKHNSSFIVHAIDVEQMDSFPRHGHINRATYFNLNAANILPIHIRKIIYLDGDMIVRGDISSLWNLEIKDYACAMVEDCLTYDNSIFERLEYSPENKYFNNGVVVYNLDYLRKIDFSTKAIEFIVGNPEKAYWMDQDAINVLLAKYTYHLPLKYNFQSWFLLKSHWEHYTDEYKQRVLKDSENPIVIHYIGGTKPWYFRYFGSAYYKEWERYKKLSAWNVKTSRKPINKYIKYLIKRYLMPTFYKKQIAHAWHISDNNKQFFWV